MSREEEILIRVKAQTAEAKKELGEVESSVGQVTDSIKASSSEMAAIGGSLMKVGAGLTAAIAVPLGIIAKEFVSAAADFEQGMASVMAVSNATGDAFEALSDQAKHLGATTRFTATEAAEGMMMLGRAGWEANEILEAMPGLLNMAAAGMVDLGTAADIVSDVMMAFGANASEASRYSDIFAAAAANANTTIEGLGQGMAYAAPSAASMGVSVEQASATLALFADSGIKASRAGTTLDAMFRELRNKVQDGALDFEYFNVAVYDSSGAMRDYFDIMSDIFAGMDGLTQQQRDHAASLVFTTRALRGFNVLQGVGVERMREMESVLLSSAGAGETMADIIMDTLQGSIIELTSAIDGLKISFGEFLLPMVTAAVKAFTGLVRTITEIPDSIKILGMAFGALLVVLSVSILLLGTLMSSLASLTKANVTLAAAKIAVGNTLLWFNTLIALSGGKVGLLTFMVKGLIASLKGLALGIINVTVGALVGLKNILVVLATKIIPALIAKATALFIALGPPGWIIGAIAAIAGAIYGISKAINSTSRVINDEWKAAIDGFAGVLGNVEERSKALVQTLEDVTNSFELLQIAGSSATDEMVENVLQGYIDLATGIEEEMNRAKIAHLQAIKTMMELDEVFSEGDVERVRQIIEGQFNALTSGFEQGFSEIDQIVKNYNDGIIDGVTAAEQIKGSIENHFAEATKAITGMVADSSDLLTTMESGYAENAMAAENMLRQIVNSTKDMREGIEDEYDSIMSSLQAAWGGATEAQRRDLEELMNQTAMWRANELIGIDKFERDALGMWREYAKEVRKAVDIENIIDPQELPWFKSIPRWWAENYTGPFIEVFDNLTDRQVELNNRMRDTSNYYAELEKSATDSLSGIEESTRRVMIGTESWSDIIIDSAKQMYEAAMPHIREFADEGAIVLGTFIGNITEGILQMGIDAAETFDKIIEAVGYTFEGIKETAINWVIEQKEALVEQYEETRDGIIAAFEGVLQYLEELPEKVWDWLVETYNTVVEWKDDMIEEAKNTAIEFIESIKTELRNLPDTIRKALADALEEVIRSIPLFGDLAYELGAAIVDGFKRGMDMQSPSFIERTLKDLAELSSQISSQIDRDVQRMGRATQDHILPHGGVDDTLGRISKSVGESDQGIRGIATSQIQNIFQIEKIEVRDDQDIEKVAQQLYNLQQQKRRGIA